MIAEIDEFLVYDEMSDGADWTSTNRLFQSRGPAVANERSPTVTSRDGDAILQCNNRHAYCSVSLVNKATAGHLLLRIFTHDTSRIV